MSKFYEVKVLLRSDKYERDVERMIADALEVLAVKEAIEVVAVKAKRLSWGGGATTRGRSTK